MFEKMRLRHERALENKRRSPQENQFYPTPYTKASQYVEVDQIISSLRLNDPDGLYDDSMDVFTKWTSTGIEHVDPETTSEARRVMDAQVDTIEPSLRTKIDIFKQDLPI